VPEVQACDTPVCCPRCNTQVPLTAALRTSGADAHCWRCGSVVTLPGSQVHGAR
jgi:hypothetical protein